MAGWAGAHEVDRLYLQVEQADAVARQPYARAGSASCAVATTAGAPTPLSAGPQLGAPSMITTCSAASISRRERTEVPSPCRTSSTCTGIRAPQEDEHGPKPRVAAPAGPVPGDAVTVGIQQLMWEIERIRDAFHEAVYVTGDLDAALAGTTADCTLVNLPTGTGAGGEELRRHLADDVLPHLPADLRFRRLSRTVDKVRVVEESTVAFTHDRELPWLLPGVAATGRPVEVLAISVVTFAHSRINAHRTRSQMRAHRTLWDHTSLLAQLGLHASEVAARA